MRRDAPNKARRLEESSHKGADPASGPGPAPATTPAPPIREQDEGSSGDG